MSDALYDKAVKLVRESGNATVKNIRETLHIGLVRAQKLMDAMEFHCVVGPQNGHRSRKILDPK